MRFSILLAFATLVGATGFPSESDAQSPPAYQSPQSREEALADTRRNLTKCEAFAGDNQLRQDCIRSCQAALEVIPTGHGGQIVNYHKSCRDGVFYTQQRQDLMAVNNKKKADQQRQVELRKAEQQKAAQAEREKAAAASARAAGPGSSNSQSVSAAERIAVRVDGSIDWGEYENDRTLHSVFVGDFDRFRKGSFAVRVFMHEYLVNFQESCAPFLPPDAVTVVSTMTQVYRNAYGAQYRNVVATERITMAPRFTAGYQNFPSGPGVYAITGGLGDRNAVSNVVTLINNWRQDVDLFFDVESCQGATMAQMGENLARLTAGMQPIQSEVNAAQLLASLRVRVPQDVEANDVSTKRAKADAYWSKERASWSQPPRTQPVVFAGGGGRLKIDYAAVAPDFVIPVPDEDQYVEINVAKSYARRIRWIHVARGGLPHYTIGEHTSEQNDVYFADQQVLLKEGAKVMSCTYDAVGTLKTVSYWYREMPKSMDPASLRASSANHPLLAVRAQRTNCPVTMP